MPISIEVSIAPPSRHFMVCNHSSRPISARKILAMVFPYFPPFFSQILDFFCRTFFILILMFFERRDTENRNSTLPMNKEILYNFVIQALTSRSGLKGINTTHISLSLILHSLPVSETFWKGKGRPRFKTFFWETNF